MAKTGIAKSTNSAAVSTPAARPAASQPAKGGQQGAQTGEEINLDLPSADEVAAHLNASPGAGTDDDDGDGDGADGANDGSQDGGEGDGAGAGDGEGSGELDGADEGAGEGSDEPEGAGASGDAAANAGDGSGEEGADGAGAAGTGKPGLDHRFGVLTAKASAAEAEANNLREQLATVRYDTPAFGSLGLVDDLPSLRKAEANEVQLHRWALRNESNPDGADLPDGKGGTRHFEPEEIREIKANTFETLYSHVPARREYLTKKAAAEAEAVKAYPFLLKTKEGAGAEVQAMIEERPYLRQAPDYRTLATDAHIGAKLRKAGIRLDDKAIAALAKGKAPALRTGGTPPVAGSPGLVAPIVRRTAPSPSRPGVLPARLHGREAAARAAEKRLVASDGSLNDIASSIASGMR